MSRQTILFWAPIVVLFAIAILMRLYQLGLPFDRDGYDEGVYWQSLRAMSAGSALYRDIFYSQPPGFLLSIYPLYALFGPSLWSARLGIALVSPSNADNGVSRRQVAVVPEGVERREKLSSGQVPGRTKYDQRNGILHSELGR